MEAHESRPRSFGLRRGWTCLLGTVLVLSAAQSSGAAVAGKLSCSTISPAFVTRYLAVGVTTPSSSGWDRGTLNCTYPELIQPKEGENLVTVGYLIHATAKDWKKFESAAAASGQGVIRPPIGYEAVGYVDFVSPSSSASVLAVRDGRTIFTVLAVPEAGFLSLERLAKKMAPLVRT